MQIPPNLPLEIRNDLHAHIPIKDGFPGLVRNLVDNSTKQEDKIKSWVMSMNQWHPEPYLAVHWLGEAGDAARTPQRRLLRLVTGGGGVARHPRLLLLGLQENTKRTREKKRNGSENTKAAAGGSLGKKKREKQDPPARALRRPHGRWRRGDGAAALPASSCSPRSACAAAPRRTPRPPWFLLSLSLSRISSCCGR